MLLSYNYVFVAEPFIEFSEEACTVMDKSQQIIRYFSMFIFAIRKIIDMRQKNLSIAVPTFCFLVPEVAT